MITFLAKDNGVEVFRDGELVAFIRPFMDTGIAIDRRVPCAIAVPPFRHFTDQSQPILIQFSEPPP